MVHQRFSTNTFPSWPLAHPFRYISHNGEINTLLGNNNWMKAREALFESELFGEDIRDLLPVIVEGGSDSAMFDNALEMLVMSGRSLPHAMMMLIPEAWDGHETMNDEKKAFYEYHSCLMEPWDGPASMVFTDGVVIGATLDRNGLRPSRYYVMKDGLVVMASEVGVLDIPAENILRKGRLQPGKMFLIDTREGRIIDDTELKHKIATEKPYRQWLNENLVRLADLPGHPVPEPDHATVLLRQQVFGYTHEDLRILMAPMAKNGEEALGSMGTDTPLAVLSDKTPPLYNYFKQLFAQVTNPPLDAIREELVTSMSTALGPEKNLLNPTAESCRLIKILSPIMDNDDLEKLRNISVDGFRSVTLPMCFKASEGGEGMRRALQDLFETATLAIRSGATILILSDRQIDKDFAPIPSLLATAGLHHHLVREGSRTKATLIVETGDAREVHHYCLLIGYGASAVNPYLAFETLDDMIRQRMLTGIDHRKAVNHYIEGREKGCPEGDVEDGHLDASKLSRSSDVRSRRIGPEVRRRLFHEHAFTHRRHRSCRNCSGNDRTSSPGVSRTAGAPARPRLGRAVSVASGWRVPHVQSRLDSQAAVLDANEQLQDLQGIQRSHERAQPEALHVARPDGSAFRCGSNSSERDRTC